MIRYPDGCRQLIIGEDIDGSAAGAMCLNSTIDIDLLNENFELTAYHGLRKPHENDEEPSDVAKSTSELLQFVFSQMSCEHTARSSGRSSNDNSFHERQATEATDDKRCSEETEELCKSRSDQIARPDVPSTDVGDLPSILNDVDVQFHSKMQASILAEAMLELSRKRNAPLLAVQVDETVQSRLIHDLLPPPTYHGEKNAFILEIFAMRDGMRPHWSFDFLEAAFDSFPDLDYCVVLLPSTRPPQKYLQHFMRVPFRCNKDFPMILYVLHRAVLFGEIKCRRAEVRDRNTVQGLLAAMPTKHETLADFDLAMDPLQLDLDCFVFECNDTMLGLAILSRYHVEDYVSMQSIHQDDYGRLLHFVLTPIFFAYHRFFFREIARLSGLTVIFYRLQHEDESALTRKRPLASCLSDMIPVNPRKQAGYRFPVISEKINMTEVGTKDDDMFSLFMTSPRLAMMPRVMIDLRIVIVGASNCGVALAEYLALRSMCRYTNLTLISPHGLPFDKERSPVETSLLPFRGTFCPEYRRCVAVRTWVNIVYGTMTAINRKEKYVTVMNQGNLAYDYLVLTCGLQYQRPTLQGETKARKRGEEVTVGSTTELPWNCLTINDDTEASVCLRKIRWLTEDLQEERAILLYGRNIDCYCALRGLIEFGVNPRWITLIEPSLNSDETDDDVFYCDREVDEAVTNAVLQNGVRVLSGWCMIDWSLTRRIDGQIAIENITIEKKGETRTLLCDILLNFHEKTINLNAFFAFCRAGLVFNGSLIIDLECRTNDPFIFAAGTMTKYSRRFRAESSQHIYFSSIEVGQRTFEVQDMIALYGKHEIMLNELKFRFKNSSVSDLYAYFREPWATAIFHDRFECLRAENRVVLLSRTHAHTDSMVDDCVSALIKSKWQEISKQDRRYIESRYAGSIYYRKLENNLVSFLEFYESDLPMYCTPCKQRRMYMDVEDSPLYFEQ
ncbi:Uncharacterized protein C20orf26-like protein [Harpegnathos saltator]|uniref:Uncharacterized protein C20orf26-like protein n=1 Tax=Harpegnathos saltator TaxID=610380 RepID=E2BP73_HARSA|nr:Uncharacterized protein C20orf26-like protein [Harpegnathos saltator]